ncbi:MAG: hypothetical protein IPK04_08250 [Bdellovibrionales bacterium]|nr:hypothetical protein [Bdellovibrionales bacterium]
MKKNLPIALSFLICGAAVVLAQAETKNVQPAWSTTPAYRTLLQKIEPLIKEQKFQAALTLASEEAPRITDPLDQARIMTKITQLEIGLHGTETAVKSLRQKKWPSDDRAQTLLHIFYAFNLQQYAHTYSWEISQRTKVAGNTANQAEIDLKTLTGLEIYSEAITSLTAVCRFAKN